MPYPHERQIEYWTSREIEHYFDNLHYSVVVIPNSQRLEKYIPFDHLIASSHLVKAFGLQYKRLYDTPDEHWRLEQDQHWTLHSYPWIYYALSEVRSIREHRNALHLLKIATPAQMALASGGSVIRLPAHSNYQVLPFARWGGFVQGLFQCNFGERIREIAQLEAMVGRAQDIREALIDLYIVAAGPPSVVVRLSPFVADVTAPMRDEPEEQMFDLGLDQSERG